MFCEENMPFSAQIKKICLFFILLSCSLFAAVEFLGLQVSAENESVLLEWSTSSETANQGFVLERKTDSTAAWDFLDSYIYNDLLRGRGSVSSLTNYSYVDSLVSVGQFYLYRISGVDNAGNFGRLDSVSVLLSETGTSPELPGSFTLNAYPNPFNAETTLDFSLDRNVPVLLLQVYDIGGNICFSQRIHDPSAGNRRFILRSGTLSSGVYFCSLQALGYDGKKRQITKKLLLLK